MSSFDSKNTNTSIPQTCTYVFRFDEDDTASPDETRTILQSYLGSAHEVVSASRLKFNTTQTNNTSVIHHVVKVKTCAPTEVAIKLIGNNAWVREDHILFKALPSSPSTKTTTKEEQHSS
jgi:hypothetical protein